MPPPPAELFASRIFLGPALRVQPDGRLVGLVREGYDSAFEEIVRRYGRPLERFAAAIVGGRSEDVTQDAFSKALLALRRSKAEIELRPWLYRIVRNTALNDLRDRGPAPEQLSEALAGSTSAAAEAERREELSDLMKRLRALPEPQRAAIVMRELEGLSHKEIASALGVSGGAARQAIYRARAALRDGLGLLVPMPVVRGLIEHGGDAVRGGAIAAGAGASTAGGALSGLGTGAALKLGAATLLVAGTVGAGVAIENHRGAGGPEAAIAAPLDRGAASSSPREGAAPGAGDPSDRGGDSSRHGGGGGEGHGGSSGSGSGPDRSLSSGTGTRSGSGGPAGGSGDGGGSGSHHGGSGGDDPSGSEGPGHSGGGDDHSGLDGTSSDDNGGDGGSSGGDGISGTSGGDGGGLDDGGTPSSGDGSGGGESGSGETTARANPSKRPAAATARAPAATAPAPASSAAATALPPWTKSHSRVIFAAAPGFSHGWLFHFD